MLATWLLWTAAGSALLGRIPAAPRRLVPAIEAAIAVALPLTVFAVRASKVMFGRIPGELLGPGPMFITSLATLSIFCALSGWLFAAATRLYSAETALSAAEAAGAVYLYEAVGACLGGVVASLALGRHWTTFDIASILAMLNLAAASALAIRTPWRRAIAIAALAGIPVASPMLEASSLALLWRGFHVVETRNTPFGNLAVTETAGTHSLFENGLIALTVLALDAAEEAVHYALLQHPAPHSMLMIGGGANGSLREALKHASIERIDYVELDPAVFDLAKKHFPAAIPGGPRIHFHNTDGRLFLQTAESRYDVILVNLPDPQTAQINRFYTLEFFREVSSKLNPGGVFSFQVTGAEDYISPELADLLRCLHKTLGQAFAEVTALPGDPVHFFASARRGVLTGDAREIVARLRARGLKTSYVSEYFIPFRMSPDRMRQLDTHIAPLAGTPVNRDFAPVAYYFDTVLWSSRFHGTSGLQRFARLGYGPFLVALAVAMLAAVVLLRGSAASAAGFAVAAMGLTSIGIEILILLAFQATYGYIYQQLAVVIAALMAGLAAGAWRGSRSAAGLRALAGLQLIAAAAPLALCLLFDALSQFRAPAVFPAVALLSGFLAGYQFSVAARIYVQSARSAGALYALDLLGACVGAVAISVFLLPVFGFYRTAIALAIVNVAPAALCGLRRPAR
jgi:spermidine synthase